MIAMMDLERALNILGHRDEEIPCARSVRRAYLKQALKIHPDKQHTTEGRKASTEAFAQLRQAYDVATRELRIKEQDEEAARSVAAIDEILKRAFEGMDVEDDLAALGVFRPDPMFGVDHRVSFERHPPREHHIDPELLQEMIEKLLEPDGDTSCSNESDY
jgi:hypothetical protein